MRAPAGIFLWLTLAWTFAPVQGELRADDVASATANSEQPPEKSARAAGQSGRSGEKGRRSPRRCGARRSRLRRPKAEELKVRPDEKGRVRFNFNGQPWPAVLEWLAQISGMSLDWQELPGDYLNLTTQRSYTIEEARDLINRHLLARGFTLLCQGELLTVANIKKLDPSLVPRVEPRELERRGAARVRQGLLSLRLADGRNGGRRTQTDAQPERETQRACGNQSC